MFYVIKCSYILGPHHYKQAFHLHGCHTGHSEVTQAAQPAQEGRPPTLHMSCIPALCPECLHYLPPPSTSHLVAMSEKCLLRSQKFPQGGTNTLQDQWTQYSLRSHPALCWASSELTVSGS